MHPDAPNPMLDYYPCTYGQSTVTFRGPRVSLDGPYTVVLGGSEVYGQYVEDPFCDQLAERTGRRVVNLGAMNAGLDLFIRDPHLMEVIGGAETVVVQAMGAHNLSNRFYTVHPRRNDRYLRHSILMEGLFPRVDFSDFAFTRHMMHALQAHSPEAFAEVRQELRVAWVSRMRLLLNRVPGEKVILMLENRNDFGLGPEPAFVDMDMMEMLEGNMDKFVQCDVTDDYGDAGLSQMSFPEAERERARMLLPPSGHERVGDALAQVIRRRDGIAA